MSLVNVYSVSFDNAGNEYATGGDVLDKDYNSVFSLSAWFKSTDSNGAVIIGKMESSGNYRGYEMRMTNDGRIRFSLP